MSDCLCLDVKIYKLLLLDWAGDCWDTLDLTALATPQPLKTCNGQSLTSANVWGNRSNLTLHELIGLLVEFLLFSMLHVKLDLSNWDCLHVDWGSAR
jgi:hypothetical protein